MPAEVARGAGRRGLTFAYDERASSTASLSAYRLGNPWRWWAQRQRKKYLINLLIRFYDPDQGTIRLDGRISGNCR